MQPIRLTGLICWLLFAGGWGTCLYASDHLGDDTEVPAPVKSTRSGNSADLLKKGKDRLAKGEIRCAISTFKKIIKKHSDTQAAKEAHHLLGKSFMARGRWTKAFNTFQELISKHPDYENFEQVIGAQFRCASALQEGSRSRIFWVIPAFTQYDTAMQQFGQIVRRAPYSDYASLALMNIALIAEQEGESDRALNALNRLINDYPQSMLTADAYYTIARIYSRLVQGPEYDQGATRQAIRYCEDFLILFPKSSYLAEVESQLQLMQNLLAGSRLDLADFYYNHRLNNTAALILYNETITLAPRSESADEARRRIADIEAKRRPVKRGGQRL